MIVEAEDFVLIEVVRNKYVGQGAWEVVADEIRIGGERYLPVAFMSFLGRRKGKPRHWVCQKKIEGSGGLSMTHYVPQQQERRWDKGIFLFIRKWYVMYENGEIILWAGIWKSGPECECKCRFLGKGLEKLGGWEKRRKNIVSRGMIQQVRNERVGISPFKD
ncbi:hypothetical protein PAPYR_10970 [Paratrimastix pyriformis]|uniref:Uncharacterized protein n=1 Tax=Paratrimastix pyriformis TaxID=342808 RepID=A0ABQ8UAI3_9EUKA|nr:hypothetical protein PAPYR_10970 [Paratrimastix pyriformis]